MVTNTKPSQTTTRERETRRRLKPTERRAELLDAAIRVLRDRDLDDVRVDDVTRAAGTAKGNFYRYFASWNDLLLAVRERLLSEYAAETRQRLEVSQQSGEQWTVLEAECIHFVDFLGDLGDLHKVLFHGPIADQPINSANSAETLVAEAIRAAMRSGACRSVDVDAAAPLLFSALHTTADEIGSGRERERWVAALLDMLRVWLRAANNVAAGPDGANGGAEGAIDE